MTQTAIKYQPYSKYKSSGIAWLGDIPDTWEVKKLKHLTECLDGRRIPLNSEQRGEMRGEYPYWGANTIVDYVNDWLFDEDLVLLGEDGAPFFDSNKDVAFYVNGKLWVNNHAHILKAKKILPKLLAHILNRIDYKAFIDGSTRDKLTQSDMNSIPIQLPPIKIQEAIVSFIDRKTAKIDNVINKKQKLIELLKEKRQALITHAVTKGLDPNAKLKQTGIEWLEDIPKEWEVKRLRFLSNGLFEYGANEEAVEVNPNDPRYIRITDIKDDGELYEETFRSLSPEKANPYMLEDGDILFARSGATVGKTFRYKESWGKCCYAGYLIRMRPD